MSIAKKKAVKDPKMVAALKLLKKLQDKHSGVVETSDLPEEFRILLVTTGFLRQVSKGWYVCSNPKDGPGDSTSWFASFWPFLSGYQRGDLFEKRRALMQEWANYCACMGPPQSSGQPTSGYRSSANGRQIVAPHQILLAPENFLISPSDKPRDGSPSATSKPRQFLKIRFDYLLPL